MGEAIYIVRKLNRLLYVEKEPYLQDWALEQDFYPGLKTAKLLTNDNLGPSKRVMLKHFLDCQVNRIIDICHDLERALLAK